MGGGGKGRSSNRVAPVDDEVDEEAASSAEPGTAAVAVGLPGQGSSLPSPLSTAPRETLPASAEPRELADSSTVWSASLDVAAGPGSVPLSRAASAHGARGGDAAATAERDHHPQHPQNGSTLSGVLPPIVTTRGTAQTKATTDNEDDHEDDAASSRWPERPRTPRSHEEMEAAASLYDQLSASRSFPQPSLGEGQDAADPSAGSGWHGDRMEAARPPSLVVRAPASVEVRANSGDAPAAMAPVRVPPSPLSPARAAPLQGRASPRPPEPTAAATAAPRPLDTTPLPPVNAHGSNPRIVGSSEMLGPSTDEHLGVRRDSYGDRGDSSSEERLSLTRARTGSIHSTTSSTGGGLCGVKRASNGSVAAAPLGRMSNGSASGGGIAGTIAPPSGFGDVQELPEDYDDLMDVIPTMAEARAAQRVVRQQRKRFYNKWAYQIIKWVEANGIVGKLAVLFMLTLLLVPVGAVALYYAYSTPNPPDPQSLLPGFWQSVWLAWTMIAVRLALRSWGRFCLCVFDG